MTKTPAQFNDFVSLAVMLLMFAALLGGRSPAAANDEKQFHEINSIVMSKDRLAIELDDQISDQALKMGIAVASELSHFRGEDE